MTDDAQSAEQRRRGIPPQFDPRNFDPRHLDPRQAMNPAALERMLQAQAAARAQASAASTVVIATMVSLVTSAFGFVAALAWNGAIEQIITENEDSGGLKHIFGLNLSPGQVQLVYAAIVTVVAVLAIVIINRFARDIAKKSVITNTGN